MARQTRTETATIIRAPAIERFSMTYLRVRESMQFIRPCVGNETLSQRRKRPKHRVLLAVRWRFAAIMTAPATHVMKLSEAERMSLPQSQIKIGRASCRER